MTSNHDEKPILSQRQIEVLQAVAKGLSNQEIARELTISVNTVRVHLRNIFEKIEVQSRTEATMWAIQRGWVTPGTTLAESGPQVEHPMADNAPLLPQLSGWQRIYFIAALMIALFVVAVPAIKPALHPLKAEVLPPRFDDRWSAVVEMPTARSRLALVAYEDELYVIGGDRTSGATGLVEILSPGTITWREGASKPTPTAAVQGIVIDDQIYVAGGCTADTEAVDALEIFDPKENIWRSGASLPFPLCAYAATAYEGELYLFGGWNGAEYVDAAYVYSPVQDEWRLLDQPYPLKVGYAAAATLKDKIYVAGGYDGQKEYAAVNVLNLETMDWTAQTPLNQPRGGLGLVAVNEDLYAIGGGWTTFLASSEQLPAGSTAWQELNSPYLREWRNFGATVMGANIFMAGGWNGDYLNLIVSYRTLFKLFLPVVQ